MLQFLCKTLLKFHGWKISDQIGIEQVPKCVMIAAPHTSNWDYYYTMLIFYGMGVKLRFLAKHTLFKFPMGGLMRATGGIPVNRSKNNFLIPKMIKLFEASDELILLIAVEGTRSYTQKWKPGFYHIAQSAQVPIVLGYLDYARKTGGFDSVYNPTGNYDKDLAEIQQRYTKFTGKHPKQYHQ
jgi:1-acyl-sn-glycerol-3-phosphate acyltransferase